MKFNICTKFIMLLYLSTSLSAMEVAPLLRDFISTQEVRTILTTAGVVGGCYVAYWKLLSMDNERKPDSDWNEDDIYPPLRIAALTIPITLLQGIPFGIARVFAERYGPWPQADSLKPFLIAVAFSSVPGFCQGFLGKEKLNSNDVLEKSKNGMRQMIRWLFPSLHVAFAWTMFQRYRTSQINT